MGSKSLLRNRFTSWQKFNSASEIALLAVLPKKPDVYAIRRTQPICGFVGYSDLVYIGSAKNKNGLRG